MDVTLYNVKFYSNRCRFPLFLMFRGLTFLWTQSDIAVSKSTVGLDEQFSTSCSSNSALSLTSRALRHGVNRQTSWHGVRHGQSPHRAADSHAVMAEWKENCLESCLSVWSLDLHYWTVNNCHSADVGLIG